MVKITDLAHRTGFRVSKDYLKERLLARALNHPHHPLREHLNALHWDRVPRLDSLLPVYFGAPDNAYTRAVGALTLIAAVRRTRRPGTKFDQLLILEGGQGTGKSTALRCLALKPDWFTDCVSLTQDYKSTIEQTAGKWIVEVPELSGMRKAEVEHVKANLSRTHDRARGAYREFANDVPRQFIMIGTTNTDRDGTAHYLKDPTGHRRFWPVSTGTIRLDLLDTDLEQLWAEAAHREAQGEPIMLARELWGLAAAEQEQEQRVEEYP